MVKTCRNIPHIHLHEKKANKEKWHGAEIQVVIEGNWTTYRVRVVWIVMLMYLISLDIFFLRAQMSNTFYLFLFQSKILHYMRQMAVITPYAQFLFRFISETPEYDMSLCLLAALSHKHICSRAALLSCSVLFFIFNIGKMSL